MNEQTILVWLVNETKPRQVRANHTYAGQFWLEFYLKPDKLAHTVFNRDQVKFFQALNSEVTISSGD